MSQNALKADIELTAEEARQLAGIHLYAEDLSDYMTARANGEAVLKLTRQLVSRDAIPTQRLAWFQDPEFYSRRGKSLQSIYEKNGTRGDDIPRHPHFLAVLRYFIAGPELPERVKTAFAQAVEDAGGEITSDEVIEVGDAARRLTRLNRLNPPHAAEEFYKLALDYQAHPMWARMIYEKVRAVRLR